MSVHVASAFSRWKGRSVAEAHIYHSPRVDGGEFDTYYFCCKTCGNCGRHWTAVEPASEEAYRHVMEAHQPTEG